MANTKGLFFYQTNGSGGPDLLRRIWRALCEVVKEKLLLTKSCIVPDFFHASIKRQKVDEFEGFTVFHKPQLILLPDFTSKFHLKNVLTTADAHYHATVPSVAAYSAIGALAGADRFVVEAAVKDSICEIGKYLMRNPQNVLRIDIGVAFLEFRSREYRIKWCDTFLKSLTTTVGSRSLVTPYDPPTMSSAATGCRFQLGCLSKDTLQRSLALTTDGERRYGVVEMHNLKGGSEFRKSFW